MLGTVIGVLACVGLLVVGYIHGYSDAKRRFRRKLLDRLYHPGDN